MTYEDGNPDSNLAFDFGLITYSEPDPDGFMRTQLALIGQKGGTEGDVHFPYGIYGKPTAPVLDSKTGLPDSSKTCQALYAFEGNYLHIWPMEDPRLIANLPNFQDGETCSYGPAGQFQKNNSDGSWFAMCTDDGTPTGKSCWLKFGPDGLELRGPWGTITFGYNGFHLQHSPDGKTPGASFNLGGVFGLPDPLSALTSYASLKAHMISLEAALVNSGGSSLNPSNAVRFDGYQATIEQILLVLAAILPGLNPPAATTAATALTQLTIALGTPVPTTPPTGPLLVAAQSATAVG